MRLVNVKVRGRARLGIEEQGQVYVFLEEWARERNVPLTIEELFEHTDVNGYANELSGLFQSHRAETEVFSSVDLEFVAPVPNGKKIICVGLNYKKHVEESDMTLPSVPLLFSKFGNSLAGHNEVVKHPTFTNQMDYEAEVCVVMGRQARNVSKDSALNYVFGYANANDLSARDAQFVTSQWLLGKTCDGFCPVGPSVVTTDEIVDPTALDIHCSVNGETRQSSNTSYMIFSFPELIAYISKHITLEPGDIILSGTPEGVVFGMPKEERVWLKPGDEVVVEVAGLGKLCTVVGQSEVTD